MAKYKRKHTLPAPGQTCFMVHWRGQPYYLAKATPNRVALYPGLYGRNGAYLLVTLLPMHGGKPLVVNAKALRPLGKRARQKALRAQWVN